VLLRPLPYADGHELVLARQQAPRAGTANIPFSVKEIGDYREQLATLDGFVEYHGMSFTLLDRGEPDRVLTGVVSANFFDVLGVQPLHGRTFRDGDDDLGAEAVLVLSYPYWQQRFGGDPDIVGQVFEMNDRPHTVVGVLPLVPQYPRENDVYMPTSACPFRARAEARMEEDRTAFRGMTAFGRLAPGVGVDRFGAELATVAGRLQRDHPETYPDDSGYTAVTTPLADELTREARPTLLILLATTVLVLLIACANVANLTMARMSRREREFALRSALGAGRGRLLRQLVTESSLLAVAAGAFGLLVAWASLDLLVAFAALFTTRTTEVAVDGRVLAFTLGLSLLTGVAFGAAPALGARRDVALALKEAGAQATDTRARRRVRGVLTVSQVAAAFVLLIATGLLLASFYRLQQVDTGFNPENVLTAEVFPNWSKYTTPESRRQLFTDVLERLQDRPGLAAAAVANGFPMASEVGQQRRFAIEGRTYEDPDLRPELETRVISPDYFAAVGVPLLAGRTFTQLDDAETTPVAVVSRSLAERHWRDGQSPLDQRITLDDGETWVTIVGVAGDVRDHGLDREAPDQLYRPFLQGAGSPTRVLVRARTDPRALSGQVRDAVHAVDPEQPVENFLTLEETRAGATATRRLSVVLLGLFAALALVITVTGIAAVIATSVSQRTREFGLRLALGAARASILTMVLRQGLALVLAGLAIGAAGAFVLSRTLSSFLFETAPTDAGIFAGVSLVFVVTGLAACYLPARRAMGVDPLVALRDE
jgi:putative ABC transport system permease protein